MSAAPSAIKHLFFQYSSSVVNVPPVKWISWGSRSVHCRPSAFPHARTPYLKTAPETAGKDRGRKEKVHGCEYFKFLIKIVPVDLLLQVPQSGLENEPILYPCKSRS